MLPARSPLRETQDTYKLLIVKYFSTIAEGRVYVNCEWSWSVGS
jgi:hypothetical protein